MNREKPDIFRKTVEEMLHNYLLTDKMYYHLLPFFQYYHLKELEEIEKTETDEAKIKKKAMTIVHKFLELEYL